MYTACRDAPQSVFKCNRTLGYNAESLDRSLECTSGILDIIQGSSTTSPRADTINATVGSARCAVSTFRLLEVGTRIASGRSGETWTDVAIDIATAIARFLYPPLLLKKIKVIELSISIARGLSIAVTVAFAIATTLNLVKSIAELNTALAKEGENHAEIKYRVSGVIHNVTSMLALPWEGALIYNPSPILTLIGGILKALDGFAYLIHENLKPPLLAN